jgi:hypothetical protein
VSLASVLRGLRARRADLESGLVDVVERGPWADALRGRQIERSTSGATVAAIKLRAAMIDSIEAAHDKLVEVERDPRRSDLAKREDGEAAARSAFDGAVGAIAAARSAARFARGSIDAKLDGERRKHASSLLGPEDARELRAMLAALPADQRVDAIRSAVLSGADEGIVGALVHAAGPVRRRLLDEAGIDGLTWSQSIVGWDAVLSDALVLERNLALEVEASADRAAQVLGVAAADLRKTSAVEDRRAWSQVEAVLRGEEPPAAEGAA